jgi:DNA-binding transcriptional ArsR family regulator
VIGSNHYGDEYLQKWGAYAGETVERNTEKGAGLSYNGFGDDVLTHMREHETLQAAMRFGRDGNGAVVYVHTDTLPEWVPLAGEGRVVTTWSDGMKAVLGALEELERATTAEITERVDLSRQQVFDHLETLRERDVLHREQDDEDGRRVLWQDDGIHRVNDHGEVDLDPVGFDELDETEVRQLARNSIYTWEFTNRPECSDGQGEQRGETEVTTTTEATAGGDRPPTGAD